MSKKSRPWSPRERKRRKVMLRTRRHLDILRVMAVLRSNLQIHEARAFERFYTPVWPAVFVGMDPGVPGGGAAMDVVFDTYLPVRDNEGRRVCYSVGPGRVRMHPENRDHLDDVFVKPGPDLREPPAWLWPRDAVAGEVVSLVPPSSAGAGRDYLGHVYAVTVDEMINVDPQTLPPPDRRAVFWTPDESEED